MFGIRRGLFGTNRVGLTMSESCPLGPDSDRLVEIAACLKSAQ